MNTDNKIIKSEIEVIENHEQGFPNIIKVKWKGKWYRYNFSPRDLDARLNKLLKKHKVI